MHGIVLAGGRGTRMGGEKAAAVLAGRTLLDRALAALEPVCPRRAVVVKTATRLPPLPEGVERWDEREADHHPRHGIADAVRRTGDTVVLLAVDLPLVPPALLRDLADGVEAGATAAVARAEHRIQPLCGAYSARALAVLEAADRSESLIRTVERLAPVVVDVHPDVLWNVNTPEDLARAESILGGQARGGC